MKQTSFGFGFLKYDSVCVFKCLEIKENEKEKLTLS